MEKQFRVRISKDRLKAELSCDGLLEEEFSISVNELLQFLKEEKVVFGINKELVEKIANNPHQITFPVTIAEGKPPKNGHDAYLVNEIKKEEKREKFHFRNVIDIPTVHNGQLLATIIPATPGTAGIDVSGNPIRAKDGKPLRVRAGKNVLFHLEQFYATADGQVSMTNRAINVNPVFEVQGDLDMKTGNIDFTGNVVIRGNVPTGYVIKAGGDIKIYGLVEGAFLEAEGSIVVSGGISGEKRGRVIAGSNVQASYINQAYVEAGADVFATASIMHSQVISGGSIKCENGSIIGGEMKARSHIFAKEVGNHLFTKTVLQLGADTSFDEQERKLRAEIKELTDTIKKLSQIEKKFALAKKAGKLPQNQLLLLSKQKATMNQLTELLIEKDEDLKEIEEAKKEVSNVSVCVTGIVYPNSHLQFGKYAKVIQKEHQNAKFWYEDGEILFQPYL